MKICPSLAVHLLVDCPHYSTLRAGLSRIKSQWGRDFLPVQTGPGAHPASVKWVPGGKVRPGRAADHSPHSSAAVMEE